MMVEQRVHVFGEVDLATCEVLHDRLSEIAAVSADDLVLDCTDLEFMDSSGIRVLIDIRNALGLEGRRLRICHLPPITSRAIEILGLTEMLGVETPTGAQAASGETDEARLAELTASVEGLSRAMRRRAVIEQAKGVVMCTTGCGPEAAFELLVDRSQAENREVYEIATELTVGQGQLDRQHQRPSPSSFA